jgi:hypothetical protein
MTRSRHFAAPTLKPSHKRINRRLYIPSSHTLAATSCGLSPDTAHSKPSNPKSSFQQQIDLQQLQHDNFLKTNSSTAALCAHLIKPQVVDF